MLIDFARARVGYKASEDIFVLAQMPLNTTGKVDRVMLKKMAEERLSGGERSDGWNALVVVELGVDLCAVNSIARHSTSYQQEVRKC